MSPARKALSYAFPLVVPIGVSFFFIGIGFGLFTVSRGFPWWVSPALAATIFAGSMEFVTVGLLMASFDPVNAFLLTLFVNGRHIFYGLSMLSKYVGMGWKWFPTVYWMCDESFAVNAATKLPDDVDKQWFYFHVSWLNYVFWLVSTAMGGLFGGLLADADLRGVEFVLPGLFIVVFLEMLLTATRGAIKAFGVAGAVTAVLSLAVFGKSVFMLLSMTGMLIVCYVTFRWGGVRID